MCEEGAKKWNLLPTSENMFTGCATTMYVATNRLPRTRRILKGSKKVEQTDSRPKLLVRLAPKPSGQQQAVNKNTSKAVGTVNKVCSQEREERKKSSTESKSQLR